MEVITKDEFLPFLKRLELIESEIHIYKSIPLSIKYISRRQAGEILKVSEKSIDRLLNSRELAYIKEIKSVHVCLESLICYMKKMHIKDLSIIDRIKRIAA